MGGFVRIVLGVSVNNDSHYPATIKLRRLDPDIPVPQRAHRGDAGVDLSATTDVIIHPGERLLVGTGIAIALPLGMVAWVEHCQCPRHNRRRLPW